MHRCVKQHRTQRRMGGHFSPAGSVVPERAPVARSLAFGQQVPPSGLQHPSRAISAMTPLLTAVGALACTRIPFSYAPWSLPLAAAVIAITAVTLICDRERRRVGVLLLLATGALAAVVTLLILWQNAAAFEAIQQSLYPGQRRSSGENLGLARVFAAPFEGWMQDPPNPAGGNPSEFSSSWTFLAVALFGLAIATSVAGRSASTRSRRSAGGGSLAITATGANAS